jgi:hypothetical protein
MFWEQQLLYYVPKTAYLSVGNNDYITTFKIKHNAPNRKYYMAHKTQVHSGYGMDAWNPHIYDAANRSISMRPGFIVYSFVAILGKIR